MAIPNPPKPRLPRAVSLPLGAYFRGGRDHLALQALLASDRHNFTGVVYDAHDAEQHDELRRVARERHLEYWRLALGAIHKSGPPSSFAKTPDGQRAHPSLRRRA
jgi:hypothetical protein